MPASLTAPPEMLIGEGSPTGYITPASGQTYKIGDILIRDANGQATVAVADNTTMGAGDLLGVSCHNAADILTGNYTRSATRGGGYVPWKPGQRVWLPLYHGTPASAIIIEGSIDAPTNLDLRRQGGVWALDVSSTTNPKFRIEDVHPAHGFGVQYGWVKAVMLDSADFMGV